ncbi:MAG: aminotransferase class III-fold pyridoxal phosphate-dependent enzyme [Verrucomicrobiota bacterium]
MMIKEIAKTIGDRLSEDEELSDALAAALQRVQSYSNEIKGIRSAEEDLATSYEEAIRTFNQTRGGNRYFPFIGSGVGRGPFVELGDGSVKLDFINGIGSHPFGHSHPAIMESALRASLGDSVMQGNLQQNAEGSRFSQKILHAANGHSDLFQHCFLSSTGVMAGENMLKIAFQARFPADRIIAFEKCFAGRTIAFSQITDKAAFRQGLPQALQVDYVPFFDASDPEGSTQRAVSTLQAHLKRHPGKHAAFIYELVQGEGGFYPGTTEFFKALMEVCREHSVLNLCDEVQTFARLPELFAFRYFRLENWVDGLWIGKSSQVCASLFKAEHKPKPGLLSQTFTSSSAAIAAGECIVDLITEGDYLGPNGKISELSAYFTQGLAAIAQKQPNCIQGPFGIGAMTAFTPFQGDPAQAGKIVKALFDKGLMSFIAGANPTRIRFLWPIGVTEKEHIDIALRIVENTLSEAAG